RDRAQASPAARSACRSLSATPRSVPRSRAYLALPQLHGAGPDHFLDVVDQLRRRIHANLRADVDLHADPVGALARFDLERYLAIAPVARKDFAERFERAAVGRLFQVNRDLARDALANAVERRHLRRDNPHRLIVPLQLAADE